MPRVTLAEKPSYEHSHSMLIRATDINYGGHLGNETLLGLVHEARAHFLKAVNFITIIGGKQTVGLVANYKAEGFAHEEVTVESQIDELGQKSFRLFHRIQRGEQVIALVEMGMVAYSYSKRTPVHLPTEFLNGLQEYRKMKTENT